MTTRNRTSVFMADFAGSDRRSVKAHIKGNSLRAKSFSTFTAVAKAVGRGDRAADDFSIVICACMPGAARHERSTFKKSHGLASLLQKKAALKCIKARAAWQTWRKS